MKSIYLSLSIGKEGVVIAIICCFISSLFGDLCLTKESIFL